MVVFHPRRFPDFHGDLTVDMQENVLVCVEIHSQVFEGDQAAYWQLTLKYL